MCGYNKNLLSLLLGLAVLVMVVLYFFLLPETNEPLLVADVGTTSKETRVTVELIELSREVIEIEVGGFTSAKHASHLSSKVAGYIDTISTNLVVGKRLKKGDVLLTIDTIDYRVALIEAQQQLAEANVVYLEEKARADHAEKAINTYKSDRFSPLAKRIPQLMQAQANLDAKQIAVEKAQQDLTSTTVRAPFDGQILSSYVAPAEWIDRNKKIITLANTSVLTVSIPLSKDQWALLSTEQLLVGQPVDVKFSHSDTLIIPGIIISLDPQIDKNTGSRSIVVEFSPDKLNNSNSIALGEFVKVVLKGKTIDDALWVPSSALLPSDYLWGVDKDNVLHKLPVDIYQYNNGKALVRYDNDIYKMHAFVLNPLKNFFPGQIVKVSSDEIDNL